MIEYSNFSFPQDQFIFLSSVESRSALEESTDPSIKWVPEVNPVAVKRLDVLLITHVHPVPRIRMLETPIFILPYICMTHHSIKQTDLCLKLAGVFF